MISKLYQWIWSRFGGRPWTYIIRDEAKAEPLFLYWIFLAGGMVLAHFTGGYWWIALLVLALGELIGHLFWN